MTDLTRIECQTLCGKRSATFSLYTKQDPLEEGHERICDPSRMPSSTDFAPVASGRPFQVVLPQEVLLMTISKSG